LPTERSAAYVAARAFTDPPYVLLHVPAVDDSPEVERVLTASEARDLGCKLIACAEALVEEGYDSYDNPQEVPDGSHD
jgi:hypothetical protein